MSKSKSTKKSETNAKILIKPDVNNKFLFSKEELDKASEFEKINEAKSYGKLAENYNTEKQIEPNGYSILFIFFMLFLFVFICVFIIFVSYRLIVSSVEDNND